VIRLQFVLGQDLSSRLIAWYGNGYGGYSHVDSILPDGSLAGARSDVITLSDGRKLPAGFQIRPHDYEKWARRCVVELDSTVGEAADWEDWLRKQVNRQYDKQAILGFILGRRDHGAGQWICSAAAAEGLVIGGKMPSPPIPLSQITPNSLFLMTAAIGGKVRSF